MHTYILHLITDYGYLAVFVGSIFEGETIVVLAGLLAFKNHLFLPFILVSAFFGSVVGDTTWFLLGRYRGPYMMRRWSIFKKLTTPVEIVGKRPVLISFFLRFMYGFRHIVPFSLGMTTFPIKKFVLFNSLGAILWVTVFGFLGFLFGDILEVVFGHIKRYELSLIVLVVFIFIGFNVISRLVKWLLAEKI